MDFNSHFQSARKHLLDSKKEEAEASCIKESDVTPSSSNTEETGQSDGDEEEWENVSLELIRWNILVKQIEDLNLLTMVISQRPRLVNPTLPVLHLELQQLSVVDLLDKGKGCIAELVGKWLTSIGVDPQLLIDQSEVITKEFVPEPEVGDKKIKKKSVLEETPSIQTDDNNSTENVSHEDKDIATVLDLLKVLRENFSVSLTSSIILANYCWEYCLEWNKDPDFVEYFLAATSCSSAVPCPFVKHG